MRHDGTSRFAPQYPGLLILRIGLTGSLGFTGVHFTRAALAAGHVICPIQGDLTQSEALAQEVAGICQQGPLDAVVHLAAISHVAHADLDAFYRVNVVGTGYLLDALLEAGQSPKVLLASSANVYGNTDQSPIQETLAPQPANHYAVSKLAMEFLAQTYAQRLPLFLVRPFNYTGPLHDESFLIPKLIRHFVEKRSSVSLGNLHVEREFNDVRMVCASYLGLLEKAHTGDVYNICTGQSYSLTQVLATLSEISGHAISVEVNPAFVRANEVHRLCGSPDKLRQALGVLPDFSLRDTLAWMLQEATNASMTGTPNSPHLITP